jgi:hypothetical protein
MQEEWVAEVIVNSVSTDVDITLTANADPAASLGLTTSLPNGFVMRA